MEKAHMEWRKPPIIRDTKSLLATAEKMLKRSREAAELITHSCKLTEREAKLTQVLFDFESHQNGLAVIQEDVGKLRTESEELKAKMSYGKVILAKKKELLSRLKKLLQEAAGIKGKIARLESTYGKAKQLAKYVKELSAKSDQLLEKAGVDIDRMSLESAKEAGRIESMMQRLLKDLE
jgi:hypothetical protein